MSNIIEQAPQVLALLPHYAPWDLPGSVTFIRQDDKGYFASFEVVEARMTPKDLADYRAYEVEAAFWDDNFDDGQQPSEPHFASIDDAVIYARLLESMQAVDAEIAAFHAPSECGTLAMKHLDGELKAILERSL